MNKELFVVATPIGNLEDITLRALRVLKEADVVLCEDTRVTKKMLFHYEIEKPLISYHQHSGDEKKRQVLNMINEEKRVVLVTDSGTPGISDPGNELIEFLLAHDSDIAITPVPGASAVTAIASISGFPMNSFLFLGYPPHKKGRKKFFEEVVHSPHPTIFYESPYRVIKSLRELQAMDSSLRAVAGRELTKQFETICRGALPDVIENLESRPIKGEFVVAIWKGKN